MGGGSGRRRPFRVRLSPDAPDREAFEAALGSGFELCEDASAQAVDAILIDPSELGPDARALRKARLRAPETPLVIVVPADAPPSLLAACVREGAAEVVPWDALDTLPAAIERAADRLARSRETELESAELASELGKRTRQLELALERTRDAYDQTLAALVAALDCRERETALHSHRVAVYALMIGVRLGLDDDELEDLFRGSLLHDIGKIGTPDSILLKPGTLTDDEREEMRLHAERGASLVGRIGFLRRASEIPLGHHEMWDGSGYPNGLRELDIPLHARIFAIVDVYDAIRSERPYKPARSHEEALAHIREDAGRHFDPSLVERFVCEPASTWETLAQAVRAEWSFRDALDACKRVAA